MAATASTMDRRKKMSSVFLVQHEPSPPNQALAALARTAQSMAKAPRAPMTAA